MAEKPEIPRAPKGLLARGKQLWRELHEVYDFADAPERRAILEEACRTADVVKRLQAVVDAADDLRVRGSQGQPVAMPELQELRQYRAQMAQLLKALSCPDDEETLSRSELGKLGAAARWKPGA
ncbi:P27 family phage terminase small subunit [Prescottella defluvii]|uniref:hypothetical protein n=1 Tax=Prescottella defluvii TaxID=1323361 RepID=UPI0004F32C8E|nr:hypothetical protein [Prescottella defluvii]